MDFYFIKINLIDGSQTIIKSTRNVQYGDPSILCSTCSQCYIKPDENGNTFNIFPYFPQMSARDNDGRNYAISIAFKYELLIQLNGFQLNYEEFAWINEMSSNFLFLETGVVFISTLNLQQSHDIQVMDYSGNRRILQVTEGPELYNGGQFLQLNQEIMFFCNHGQQASLFRCIFDGDNVA